MSFEFTNTKVMIVNDEGERDSMSEGEYYEENEANEEQNVYCDGDKNPSLVVTRVLTTSPQEDQDQ